MYDGGNPSGKDLEVLNNPYNPHNRIVNASGTDQATSYVLIGLLSQEDDYHPVQFYQFPKEQYDPTYFTINILRQISTNLSMTDFDLNFDAGHLDYGQTSLFDEGQLPSFKSTLALDSGDVSFNCCLSVVPYEVSTYPNQRCHEHIWISPVDGIETNTEQFTYSFLQNNNRPGSKSFCQVINGTGGATANEFMDNPVLTTGSYGPFSNFENQAGLLFFKETDTSFRKSDGTFYDVLIVYIGYPDNFAVNPDEYGDVIVPCYNDYTDFEPYLRPDLQSFSAFYDPPPERWNGAILGPKTANSQDKHMVTLYSGSLYPFNYDFTNNVNYSIGPSDFCLYLSDEFATTANFSKISNAKIMIISTNPNPTNLPYG